MSPTRRRGGTAEPARYALLGLLLSGPHHGYDLARQFDAGTPLGEVMHLTMSHLYALLAGLERDGLVRGQEESAGAHPTRRVYTLTDAGRTAALGWIDQPVDHLREMRLDFLLKLYFALQCGHNHAARLVQQQRRSISAYVAHLEGKGSPDPFVAVVRSNRLSRARAALDWLDSDVARLVGERIHPPPE